jgi:hypothetical protein
MANEIQKLEFSKVPLSGSFTFTFDGQTTAPIDHHATAISIQSALENLSNVGIGNVIVTGSFASGFTIEFVNALADIDHPEITVTSNTMVAGIPVTLTYGTQIVAGSFAYSALGTGPAATLPIANISAATVWNNKLVVAGLFESINGVPAKSIAMWDGNDWFAIDHPMTYSSPLFLTLESYNGDLYVGGAFTFTWNSVSITGIARWDGVDWHRLGIGITATASQTGAQVHCMQVWNGELYFGGRFCKPGTLDQLNIQKYDSTTNTINNVANGMNLAAVSGYTIPQMIVRSLCLFDDGSGEKLYVSGLFSGALTSGPSPLLMANTRAICRFDGTDFQAIYDSGSVFTFSAGVINGIQSLAVYNNQLHLSGNFFESASGAGHLAQWNPGQPAATLFTDLFDPTTFGLPTTIVLNEMAAIENKLYLGRSGSGTTPSFFVYDGTSVSLEAGGANNGIEILKSLTFLSKPVLIVGGYFTMLDSQSINRLAIYQSTDEIHRTIEFSDVPVTGSYRLIYDGQQTIPIEFDATSAEVQSALEALTTIGSGNVAVGDL